MRYESKRVASQPFPEAKTTMIGKNIEDKTKQRRSATNYHNFFNFFLSFALNRALEGLGWRSKCL
jgi:hypothetical protein